MDYNKKFPSSTELLAKLEEDAKTNDNEEESLENTAAWEKYANDEFSTVVTYLRGINLSEYQELFNEKGVNNEIFFFLTDEDLIDMGMVNKEHRQKLLQILSLRGNHRENFGKPSELSTTDIANVLLYTNRHLDAIQCALASYRIRLNKSEVHNSLLTTHLTSAKALSILCSEADVQAKLLNNQFNAILSEKPGVHQKKRQKSYISIVVCSMMATLTAVFYWLKRR
uniref:SAM domain-containing protein n=1 Tax=Clastoptera arizonana TaxID=38151 RepID=A0A1B6D0X1_9HEMI